MAVDARESTSVSDAGENKPKGFIALALIHFYDYSVLPFSRRDSYATNLGHLIHHAGNWHQLFSVACRFQLGAKEHIAAVERSCHIQRQPKKSTKPPSLFLLTGSKHSLFPKGQTFSIH
jgi:hypothetical protein